MSSPALRLAAAALATAAATGALSRVARRWGQGSWPCLSALLLGPDDPAQGDLRFASVVASVSAGLSWIVALDAPLKSLTPTGRVAAIGMGLPVMALLVAGLADLLSQRDEASEGAAPEQGDHCGPDDTTIMEEPAPASAAKAPSGAQKPIFDSHAHARRVPPVRREEIRSLIDEALGEVGKARARTEDASVREALASMEEALSEYAQVVDDEDADLDRIAVRVREVIALARSCDDDGSDSFRVLGLKRDCSPEDAKRVYRELAKIYHADAACAGVDPDKFKEISLAYERVREAVRNTVKVGTVDPF